MSGDIVSVTIFRDEQRVIVERYKEPLRVLYEPGMFMSAAQVRRYVEGEEVVTEEMSLDDWEKHPDNWEKGGLDKRGCRLPDPYTLRFSLPWREVI